MYEQELQFLNDNIDLIEAHDWEAICKKAHDQDVSNLYATHYDQYAYLSRFWKNILTICADPEVNFNVWEGLKGIPTEFFADFNQLDKSLILPNTIKYIGQDGFYNTNIEEIVLPEGLTSIGLRAFYSCGELTTLTLPSTLTYIGNEAFAFTGLKEVNYNNKLYNWDRELTKALMDAGVYVGEDVFHATRLRG